MKKFFFISVVFALLLYSPVKGQDGNAKEEAAIEAVIEADRAAYFKQDYNGVGNCWIKEP